MEDLIGPALAFVFFVVMMGLGFFVGGYRERAHFARLERRESRLGTVNATQVKTYIAPAPGAPPPTLVTAEVVIASDYLKTFLAGLRKIFGGEIRSYETLLQRARREATVQLLEQARTHGYNAVCNIRLDAVNLGGISTKAPPMATIIGWGTAYHSQASSLPASSDDGPLVAELL